ncbi:MAG: hypothetical protein BWY66_01005 [bacterium ADurb.Bin374]|nr:MAG: hypothetical protein BWY66_01005 [bacterium ADurb.Bin374]
MLFGDAHVEEAVGEVVREAGEPRSLLHCSGDGDHPLVFAGHLDGGLAEHARVGRGGFHLLHFAGRDLERPDPVEQRRLVYRGLVTTPLFGEHVDENGAAAVTSERERPLEKLEIVAVDRAHVFEPELLEEHSRGEQILETALDPRQHAENARADARNLLHDMGHIIFRRGEIRLHPEGVQISRQRADVRRNRHRIVVENDDHVGMQMSCMVERLERHSPGHRSVADNGDDLVALRILVAGNGHSQRGRDRRRAVPGVERVVLAFGDLRKAAQAAKRAQGRELLQTAGQHLVDVCLVADVEDDFILGRMEYPVESQGELYDAEIAGQVAAVAGNDLDDPFPDLGTQPMQLSM